MNSAVKGAPRPVPKPPDEAARPFAKVLVRLTVPDDQKQRLAALQATFAEACNHIAAIVAQACCWNRVGLHHLAYRGVRERFPGLGSQMACNAIYSVSRAARRIYQDPNSPWFAGRHHKRPLALMRFRPDAPVFFDRHTLSLKQGRISLFTLDGRLRFQLQLPAGIEEHFAHDKLHEVVLLLDAQGYALRFVFGPQSERHAEAPDAAELRVEVELPQASMDLRATNNADIQESSKRLERKSA